MYRMNPTTGAYESVEGGFHPSFELQKAPSKWSCLPTSFAMIMGWEVGAVLRWLGHDDADCFHLQELLAFAIAHGWSFTPFVFGQLEIDGSEFYRPIEPSLQTLLQGHNGVLTGLSLPDKKPHAVAWCAKVKKVLDPMGAVYSFEGFDPDCFWIGAKNV